MPSDEKSEARKGRAFMFIKTSTGLVPLSKLREAEVKQKKTPEERAATKQIKSDTKYMTEYNLVPLPFPVLPLLQLMENCSFFDACVRQIAKDVVGQGWGLELKEDIKDETAEMKKRKKEIEDFLVDPNTEEEALEDIIERMIIDWGCIGWFGMEVARDGAGQVNGLYHIPAHTIRIHRDGHKFCQLRGMERKWFKLFGYPEDVGEKDGKETDVPKDNMAHEMIYYRNYYPPSSWYGSPLILSGVGAVKALIGIRDYNLAFFENYGVPAGLVIIEGEWDEDDAKHISDFIDTEIKGSDNAHKTVVLNPPEGGKVTWSPLVVEVKEGHFKLYFKNVRDEVLVCYKMPPYRIGIAELGSLGGTTASEATRIYIDSVVNPLKQVIERVFTQKIVKDGFKCDWYNFDLGEVDIRDMASEIDQAVKLFSIGCFSPNKVLEHLGMDKFDAEEHPWAEAHYMSTAYAEIGAEPLAARDRSMVLLETTIRDLLQDAAKAQIKAAPPRGLIPLEEEA